MGSPSLVSIVIGSVSQCWGTPRVPSVQRLVPAIFRISIMPFTSIPTVSGVPAVSVTKTSPLLFLIAIGPEVVIVAPSPLKIWTFRSSGTISDARSAVG